MGRPHEPEPEPESGTESGSEDPAEPTPASGRPDSGDEEEPTEPIPDRWRGSAAVPAPGQKRRRRGVLREPTAELPTLEEELATLEDEPWPPPPPPRPANAPVTAPYPPPRPPAWNPPPQPRAHAPARPPPGWARGPAPPYASPAGYRRRRRRRWPWVLTTFVLLTALCCGCCVSWLRPYVDEYPASATLPPTAADLVKLDDRASVAKAIELKIKMRSRHWLAEDVFAGIYAEPGTGRRRIMIFGATLLLVSPSDDLKAGFDDLTGELSLTDVRAVDPGSAGGHQRCGKGRSGGEAVAVCGWADHGSIAIGVFSGRTVTQSAALLQELRGAIITRA